LTGIADTPQGKRASIKRASKKARADLRRLDAQALADLDRAYREAARQIAADIEAYAGSDGRVGLNALRQLQAQVETRIVQLAEERNRQLAFGFDQAAAAGSAPFAAVVDAGVLMQVNHDAVQFVRHFMAEDGLQLSDRIWRIDRHTSEVVGSAIEQAVIQGHSASQAADDFLRRGERIPADVLSKMSKADAARIGREAGRALLHDDGSPRSNAMRLFRTEINRAHGEAYQAAAFEHPDTIGTRFLLSPNHRQQDICDMHARVNRYGLGPGVYPKGKNPWPAHPNTISFTEVVFSDEVSASDKSGKETRIDFLKKQPPGLRASILGGQKKRAAFDAGHIPENAIATPWKTIKKRLERKGVNIDALVKFPASGQGNGLLSGVSIDGSADDFEHVMSDLHTDHLLIADKLPKPSSIRTIGKQGFYSRRQRMLVADPIERGGNVARHEYGHHIDYELNAGNHGGLLSKSETDARFLRSYEEDKKKLGLKFSKTKFESMRALHRRLYSMETKTLPSGREVSVAQIKDISMSGISDIIDSLTFGNFQATYGGYGHGKSYYKNKGMRYKEIFANLFYLRGTEHWALTQELFPSLTKTFISVINEGLIGGVK